MATPSSTNIVRSHADAPDTADAFERLRVLREGPEREMLRGQLVKAWLPMSQRLAGKYRNRGEDSDDLRQVAALGLVKAIDRYEVARGAFEAFAIPTINGEIKRHFRDHAWAMHVPRRVQELRNRVRVARRELQACQAGEPTLAQLAVQCGLSEDDVHDGLEALNSYSALSLDAELQSAPGDDGRNLADTLGATDDNFDTVEAREAVKPALQALPERESRILYMRFFQDKTQNAIAEELGLSQMHVSRLITRTCARIREQALYEPGHQIAA
ncbi:RNA polymerase sigma factor SigF [Streptomyces hundungensis]|uniref:RNA polymerase sigma factor SigF n=1 Tax=Streptomyces hundungensis TaxID=1077946 RepID=A0A387HQ86_9ACTN|nr:SigB/SigF/SigG family RNA polymerase sigma factor [Streptomyces hundungensis]AYG84813.1 RNA polymerase sigma factor SigF [Streptomyces hundungensis]